MLQAVHNPKHEVTIGLVGKYIDLPDAYLSVTEALKAGGFAQETQVKIRWIPSDACETPEGAAKALGDVDGIVVPGGFGIRGIEGKLGALRFAREQGIPTLGLCLGLQCMVIEYARHVAGLEGASSSEFDPDTEFPVIATMAEQVDILDQRRPGRHDAPRALPGRARRGLARRRAVRRDAASTSVTATATRSTTATATRSPTPGLVFSGLSPDRNLVEYVELPRDVHPYYIATQAHPELRSRPTDAASAVPRARRRGPRAPPCQRAVRRREWLSRRLAGSRARLRRRARRAEVDRRSDLVYEGRVWDVRSDTVPLRRRRDRAPVRRSPGRRRRSSRWTTRTGCC